MENNILNFDMLAEMTPASIFIIGVIIWNIIVFIIYGIDKLLALLDVWRISERMLILFAFLMGGFGALSGMISFRHKINKSRFKILVPFSIILNVAPVWYFNAEIGQAICMGTGPLMTMITCIFVLIRIPFSR